MDELTCEHGVWIKANCWQCWDEIFATEKWDEHPDGYSKMCMCKACCSADGHVEQSPNKERKHE